MLISIRCFPGYIFRRLIITTICQDFVFFLFEPSNDVCAILLFIEAIYSALAKAFLSLRISSSENVRHFRLVALFAKNDLISKHGLSSLGCSFKVSFLSGFIGFILPGTGSSGFLRHRRRKKKIKNLNYFCFLPEDFVRFLLDFTPQVWSLAFWLLDWGLPSVLPFANSEAFAAQIWATLIAAWVSFLTSFLLCSWERVQGIHKLLLQKTGIPPQHWGQILTLACLFCMLLVKNHINQK